MTATPHECMMFEAAAIQLRVLEPGTTAHLCATVEAAQLLQNHSAWRFPPRLPVSHIEVMLGCERRWHGVVVQGCDLQ